MYQNQNTQARFKAQLREGQYNELRVALYFMLQGAHVKIGFTNHSYDISVLFPDEEPRLIEVKWDKRASVTSTNVYFEIENTNQRVPSGIMATIATHWCHVIGDGHEALIAPVASIKRILDNGNYRTVSTRGADSNSRGKIVPIEDMRVNQEIEWITLPEVEGFFNELFRNVNHVA
jgi:hypothetical protein